MSKYRQTYQDSMVVNTKEVYSFCQKIFCCKCFHCLQSEVILTTDIRKQTLQRMIKNFVIEEDVSSPPRSNRPSRTPSSS